MKEAAAGVALLVKDTKVWQSSCDWLKKSISDIADLAGNAIENTVAGILLGLKSGKNFLLYQYISQRAEGIYAALKDLVDEDALNYLQGAFHNGNVNMHISDFRLLTDTADCIGIYVSKLL